MKKKEKEFVSIIRPLSKAFKVLVVTIGGPKILYNRIQRCEKQYGPCGAPWDPGYWKGKQDVTKMRTRSEA